MWVKANFSFADLSIHKVLQKCFNKRFCDFPNLALIVELVLCILPSNSTVKGAFSTLTRTCSNISSNILELNQHKFHVGYIYPFPSVLCNFTVFKRRFDNGMFLWDILLTDLYSRNLLNSR